jgi:tRNA1(Val) A37 N6-methylase TrmN6
MVPIALSLLGAACGFLGGFVALRTTVQVHADAIEIIQKNEKIMDNKVNLSIVETKERLARIETKVEYIADEISNNRKKTTF